MQRDPFRVGENAVSRQGSTCNDVKMLLFFICRDLNVGARRKGGMFLRPLESAL